MAAQLCDDLLFLLIDVIERYLVNMKCLVSCQQAVDKMTVLTPAPPMTAIFILFLPLFFPINSFSPSLSGNPVLPPYAVTFNAPQALPRPDILPDLFRSEIRIRSPH